MRIASPPLNTTQRASVFARNSVTSPSRVTRPGTSSQRGAVEGAGNLAEMVAGGFVKVAGRAGRADMVHVFADKEEDGIAGSDRDQDSPPVQRQEALRQDGKEGHAEERARSEPRR